MKDCQRSVQYTHILLTGQASSPIYSHIGAAITIRRKKSLASFCGCQAIYAIVDRGGINHAKLSASLKETSQILERNKFLFKWDPQHVRGGHPFHQIFLVTLVFSIFDFLSHPSFPCFTHNLCVQMLLQEKQLIHALSLGNC